MFRSTRWRRRRHATSLAAVAVALVITGCGSAAPSATPPTPTGAPSAPSTSSAAASPTAVGSPIVVPSSSAVTSPMPSTIAVAPFGSVPTAKIAGARADAMQASLDSVVADGAPDVIAAIITPAGTWTGAAGVGGPDGRKATVRDEFAIASVTKTITASLVMRLAEQGKIDLDAPLQTYLGTIKANANGATVRQVLGQRSGLADWVDAPRLIKADPAHHWTQAELLGRLPPPSTEPGIGYAQAGPNYFLLGLAIEHVTGLSLSDALRTEVL